MSFAETDSSSRVDNGISPRHRQIISAFEELTSGELHESVEFIYGTDIYEAARRKLISIKQATNRVDAKYNPIIGNIRNQTIFRIADTAEDPDGEILW